ncbi:MAG: hypothetical protein DI585_03665 [Pseudomonas fluorescens]|nr:MAG: hypothetical protein DI585_03665 [Pseudomonas fluorescens]
MFSLDATPALRASFGAAHDVFGVESEHIRGRVFFKKTQPDPVDAVTVFEHVKHASEIVGLRMDEFVQNNPSAPLLRRHLQHKKVIAEQLVSIPGLEFDGFMPRH